jgi:hypothetical protein
MRKISLKLLSMGGQKDTTKPSEHPSGSESKAPWSRYHIANLVLLFFVYVFALDLVTYFEVSYIFHFGLYITTLAMAKMLIIDDRIFYS